MRARRCLCSDAQACVCYVPAGRTVGGLRLRGGSGQGPHRLDTLGNCFETGFVVSVVSIKGYGHSATCIRREGRADRWALRRENVPVRRQN